MVTSLGVKPFDIAEHLDSEQAIAEYLTSILAYGDQDVLLDAISQVARARGMAGLARVQGLAVKACAMH